ncbi:5'-nucleotidase [Rhinopithecimicrobium faecis]|uniref:5'-nucleotidase n=1 Tax=Rhinopithecimicrobium faecis TaxID=2820698 RepID=UPI0033655423
MKYVRWNGATLALLVSSIIFSTSCSKQLSPSQPIYKRYELNATVAEDSTVLAIYTPYKKKLESSMNEVIGYSPVYLTKGSTAETLMGNFFCDALLAMGKKIDPEVQLSFGTKGGIRTEIKKGDVTVGHVFEVMPFENSLTILTLSGEQILNLANFIAKTGGQPIAGMRMEIKADKAQRIELAGQPLDLSKSYKLVTYDYLANGGDNLNALNNPLKRADFPEKVRESLMTYIKELTKNKQPINTQLDGRVKIID